VTNPASGSASGAEAGKPIAVFLLDDHEVVRRGVRDLLEAEPDIRVVGEAGTASSALARIPALMDIWHRGTNRLLLTTGLARVEGENARYGRASDNCLPRR
jgi:hypothetical protein